MQVVLNQDVKKLGYRGDVVVVKPGFFRNYLLPRALADVATANRLKLAEKRNEKRVMAKQQIVDNAQEVVGKLAGVSIVLKEKANDKGHLYAAVSEEEIISALAESAKVELAREFVQMEQIKEVGEYTVKVVLADGAEAEVSVKVEAA